VYCLSSQVLLLLRQLSVPEKGGTGDSGLAERLCIQNQELEKMEILRKELEDKTKELDKLKCQSASKGQRLNKVWLYMIITTPSKKNAILPSYVFLPSQQQ
jgi:hypothetical protein